MFGKCHTLGVNILWISASVYWISLLCLFLQCTICVLLAGENVINTQPSMPDILIMTQKKHLCKKKRKKTVQFMQNIPSFFFFVSGFSSINKFRDKTSMLNKLNNKLISPTPCSESVFRLISNPLWNLGLRLIEISVVPIGETKQIIPASHLVWCDGHWRRLSTL